MQGVDLLKVTGAQFRVFEDRIVFLLHRQLSFLTAAVELGLFERARPYSRRFAWVGVPIGAVLVETGLVKAVSLNAADFFKSEFEELADKRGKAVVFGELRHDLGNKFTFIPDHEGPSVVCPPDNVVGARVLNSSRRETGTYGEDLEKRINEGLLLDCHIWFALDAVETNWSN